MENAVDALKMAAAVLIFIIAIGTSFSLFGTAKQTADSIIGMRDKQKYLEAAELDGGILYTSSERIRENDGSGNSAVSGVTLQGDRIVNVDDVISTLYRYDIEKYGVTIVEYSSGDVLARFDSNTENLMMQYYNIDFTNDTVKGAFIDYVAAIANNTDNIYISPNYTANTTNPKTDNTLYDLYRIKVDGGALDSTTSTPTSKISCGAPWYGNEAEIQKRVDCEIAGTMYSYNKQEYSGKKLYDELNGHTIIEVINEIDTSKYLVDATDGETSLLQQYQMPTVEVIYIVK